MLIIIAKVRTCAGECVPAPVVILLEGGEGGRVLRHKARLCSSSSSSEGKLQAAHSCNTLTHDALTHY
jgi:hypothetical protein